MSDVSVPLHDLVIRTVAEYLSGDNETLVTLQRVCARFYGLRDIFIGQICLLHNQSRYAYDYQPYGWNKVHSMYFWHNICINDVSALSGIRDLSFYDCPNIRDISPLHHVHSLSINYCDRITDIDISALRNIKHLFITGCKNVSNVYRCPYVLN